MLSELCDVKCRSDAELDHFFLLKYMCRTIPRKPTTVAVTMNVTTTDMAMGVAVLDSGSLECTVSCCPLHLVCISARKWTMKQFGVLFMLTLLSSLVYVELSFTYCKIYILPQPAYTLVVCCVSLYIDVVCVRFTFQSEGHSVVPASLCVGRVNLRVYLQQYTQSL